MGSRQVGMVVKRPLVVDLDLAQVLARVDVVRVPHRDRARPDRRESEGHRRWTAGGTYRRDLEPRLGHARTVRNAVVAEIAADVDEAWEHGDGEGVGDGGWWRVQRSHPRRTR